MKNNVLKMINANKRKIRFYSILSVVLIAIAFFAFIALAAEMQPEYDTIGNFLLKEIVSGVILVISGIAGLICGGIAEEGKKANKRLTRYYNSLSE